MGLLFDLRDDVEDIRTLQDKSIFIQKEIGEYFNFTKDEDKQKILYQYDRISAFVDVLSDYMGETCEALRELSDRMTAEMVKEEEHSDGSKIKAVQ